jgi:hypothetical protein
VPALALLDQHAGDHRVVSNASRAQQAFQAGRFLVELFDHSPGRLQLVVKLAPVGPFELFIFGIAIGFKLILVHPLGGLHGPLDRGDE